MVRKYQKSLINTSTKIQLTDYVSQAEAARIRKVSSQAISDLIKRGKLSTSSVAGRKVLLRSEVEAFVAQPRTGRPKKRQAAKKATSKKKP